MTDKKYKDQLYHLLQNVYFDNIDNARPDEASEAMHSKVRWVHNQVWEHDGHESGYRDALNGQDEVKEFLRKTDIKDKDKVTFDYLKNKYRDYLLENYKITTAVVDYS